MKPVPVSVRQHLGMRRKNKYNKENDDEAFMDNEIANGEDFVSIVGFPLPEEKRNSSIKKNQIHDSHIVYKRSEIGDTQFNDYGIYFHYIIKHIKQNTINPKFNDDA